MLFLSKNNFKGLLFLKKREEYWLHITRPHILWRVWTQIFPDSNQTLRLHRMIVPKVWLQFRAWPWSVLAHLWFMLHSSLVPPPFRSWLAISPQHGPQHAATSLEFTFSVYWCPSQFQKVNAEITDNQGPIWNSQTTQERGKARNLVPLPHCPR